LTKCWIPGPEIGHACDPEVLDDVIVEEASTVVSRVQFIVQAFFPKTENRGQGQSKEGAPP